MAAIAPISDLRNYGTVYGTEKRKHPLQGRMLFPVFFVWYIMKGEWRCIIQMMYPFMTLDDGAEIVHSETLPDGQVKGKRFSKPWIQMIKANA